MKDYSYTELKEMQDRAMERVRAMQQRASETVSRENSLQEEKPKPDAHTEQNSYTKPHHIKIRLIDLIINRCINRGAIMCGCG